MKGIDRTRIIIAENEEVGAVEHTRCFIVYLFVHEKNATEAWIATIGLGSEMLQILRAAGTSDSDVIVRSHDQTPNYVADFKRNSK